MQHDSVQRQQKFRDPSYNAFRFSRDAFTQMMDNDNDDDDLEEDDTKSENNASRRMDTGKQGQVRDNGPSSNSQTSQEQGQPVANTSISPGSPASGVSLVVKCIRYSIVDIH
jgi:hypothetical protein